LSAGSSIKLVNNTTTTLNHVSATNVDIQSSGDVTSTGDFTVGNSSNDAVTTINASAGSITLSGTTVVDNLTTTASDAINIVNLEAGILTATSSQNSISLGQSGQIGTATLQANADVNIDTVNITKLNAKTTDGIIVLSGASTINEATLTSGNTITVDTLTANTITMEAVNNINLADITADALNATSSNGSILSTEALTIGANVENETSLILTASNGDVSLTNENNDFGQISVVANNAEITDVNSITILGTQLTGALKLAANGDVFVGDIIANESILIESTAGAILSQDSNLTSSAVSLLAYSGIGRADFDEVNDYDSSNSSAIMTNTQQLSAINNGEDGLINIVNSEAVTVSDLRNNGDILFTNTGDITMVTTLDEGGGTVLGAVDAHYNGDKNDAVYAGNVKIFNDGESNLFTNRSIGSSLADITGESLEVSIVNQFGTPVNPIKVRLNSSLEVLSTRGSIDYVFPKPLEITTPENLSDTSSLSVLTSRNLLEVETLDELDPAIFSDIKNYNVDSLSLLLPIDQRQDDDEEEE